MTPDALLQYLDARVQVSGGAGARLSGTLCVGVRDDGRTQWWIARFGPRVHTEFTDQLPADFDAGVAVDARTALWILGAAPEAGELHLTTGDSRLLAGFVAGYIRPNDVMSMRLRGGL
jgi:hypothetical protein